jgi:threonyl-tRNA synthetase
MITITFPDKTQKQFDSNVTGLNIAQTISEGLMRATLAIKFNNRLMDATLPLVEDGTIQIITFEDPEGVEIFRHSSAHLLAHAVARLFPDAKPTIGPVVDQGFYYDFDNLPITPDDFPKIEEEMKKIVKEGLPVERKQYSTKTAALEKFKDNAYKIEMIEELGEETSAYQQGDFIDLCRGPHVPNTKVLKAFKLIKIAGAYWRGDAQNKQLTRVYGISFPDKKELKKYLIKLEETLKNDHNKLGKELGLFVVSPLVGQGLPLFTPKGTRIIKKLQRWVEDIEESYGYQQTMTPYMAKSDLYKVSGHWDHYRDGMFLVDGSGDEMALRPMTCPFQFQIYNAHKTSYRDLPVRLSETSTLFRNESSGEMHGTIRVRQFTISEAHLICRMDQVKEEFQGVVNLIEKIMGTLGLDDYWFRFSKGDRSNKKKYIDNDKAWDESEAALKEILDEIGKPYEVAEGEAAFYGPKLDIQMKNVFGKEDTIITVQIDFALPEMFNMRYTDKDNSEKHPIVIHRTSIGCYERTFAMLVEKYGGKFPLWLNPNQVKVLPITDRHRDYAFSVKEKLVEKRIYVDVDDRNESIKKKVRDAQLEKYNYMLVVGDKEEESQTVNIRARNNEVLGTKSIGELTTMLMEEIGEKRLPPELLVQTERDN